VLQASEAPAGFSNPHIAVFSQYVKKLKVKTKTKGMPGLGNSSCDADASLKAGWKQGMIESFDSSSLLLTFEVCGFPQNTVKQATAVFQTVVTSAQKSLKSTKGAKVLKLPTVGNQSLAIGDSSQGLALWVLIFRHDNAIVDVLYLGPATFSTAKLVQTAQLVNSRLH